MRSRPPHDRRLLLVGDVTAIVGANNSGKTQLLGAIRDSLTGYDEFSDFRSYEWLNARDYDEVDSALFLAGDVEALLRLTTHHSSLVIDSDEAPPLDLATHSIPVDWQLPFDGVDQKSHDVKGQLLESFRRKLDGAAAPHRDSWEVVLDRLSRSNLFSVGDGLCLWWIRSSGDDYELKTALSELKIEGWSNDGILCPVLPVGVLPGKAIPEVVSLPRRIQDAFADLKTAIEDAIHAHLRVVEMEEKQHGSSFAEGHEAVSGSPDMNERFSSAWHEHVTLPDGRRATTTPAKAHDLLESIIDVANRRLRREGSMTPYQLVAELLKPDDAGAELELSLSDTSYPEDKKRNPSNFDPSQVARGFRIWLDLDLLRLVEDLRKFTEVRNAISAPDRAMFLPDLDGVEWRESVPELAILVDEAMRDLSSQGFSLDIPPGLLDRARTIAQFTRDSDFLDFSDLLNNSDADAIHPFVPAQRIVVIDEPEQNLNPALRRKAASCLRDFALQSSAKFIIATHSPEFLRIHPEQEYLHLKRDDHGLAEVTRLSPDQLRQFEFSEVVEDLGFNRGELLTLTNVILWVEGEDDKALLENLFRDEFWANGIRVLAMHGRSRSQGLLNMTLVKDVIDVQQVVWFDRISDAFREWIENGDPWDDWARWTGRNREGSEEEQDAAKLHHEARKAGHRIWATGHPGNDVWELLDAQTVNTFVREQDPKSTYSHADLALDWKSHQDATGAKDGERKEFIARPLEGKVKIDYAEIGCRMRDAGLNKSDGPLKDIADLCAQASLFADVPAVIPPQD